MKKLLILIVFLIVSFTTLSQNTKIKIGIDSTTISNKALKSMQRESRKCDSVRVALAKKDALVTDLIENNLKMFADFNDERKKKKESIKIADAAKRKLDKFDRKRFGLGFSVGAIVDDNFNVKPAVLIGVSYSIFRF